MLHSMPDESLRIRWQRGVRDVGSVRFGEVAGPPAPRGTRAQEGRGPFEDGGAIKKSQVHRYDGFLGAVRNCMQ